MTNTWDKIVKTMAMIGGAIAGAFGGWDTMMAVLCIMMAIDYVTGLICAAMGKSGKTASGHLDSNVGWVGLARKGVILLVIVMAAQLDRIMPEGTQIFRDAMIFFYVANEGISVLENLGLMGVPFPQFVMRALEKLREKNDTGEEEETKKGA